MLSDVRVGKPSLDDVLSLDGSQQVQRTFCMKPEPATVVSLFSGCGGMDLGLSGGFRFLAKWYKPLSLDIVWANDINEFACRTYKHNLGKKIICGDIWDLMDTMPKYADVVVGGFPCQDISVNGKRAGIDGSRSGLYKAMVEAVKRLQPKIFVAENVKGLLMQNNKASLEKVISDFSSIGYEVDYRLYHAADFGVPQTRDRVFIVGTQPGVNFEPPRPILSKAEHITSEQAIADLEQMPEDESINHIWSKANRSPEQGSRCLKADRPGYTIRAECHGNIQFHYNQPRRISMREAARIQSFPDKFIFQSKLRETERQIGNAVPPVLSWHIGKAVIAALNN
ncbi:DNA cytosine methyltransferase [Microcoleus sp. LEGE 07076]|uniref:DNA cytosine methyltransferase n=1 Tax=Microcoleus sp. LEGE 07076 TaxID=915322 RepID=UPI001882F770|nr:DNA cytosine methyltransferase [Microcoleus sp. LEGE 07076]MBE9185583.1 DNA cytosine methyltransferase [Microcoleus sp. LEGE 07076]